MKEYISKSGLHVVVGNDSILEQFAYINDKKRLSKVDTPIMLCDTIFGTLDNMIRICSLVEAT